MAGRASDQPRGQVRGDAIEPTNERDHGLRARLACYQGDPWGDPWGDPGYRLGPPTSLLAWRSRRTGTLRAQ